MIIFDQNKKSIVNFDRINRIGIDMGERFKIYAEIGNQKHFLGEYNYFPIAKEIVEEIAFTYKNAKSEENVMYFMPSNDKFEENMY